jgi:hypothetical protein
MGRVQNDGVIVTLGNLESRGDHEVSVPARIYIGNVSGGGTTYVVEKVNGVWQVTGTTGGMWVS